MRFRMCREKMAGENLRDGSMEVAFELWIERNLFLVDSNGDSRRYEGKRYRKMNLFFPYCIESRN